ncbi:hypothetical protein D6D26_00201 [Aureobasidium pullulans]|nr:hypothetical protein D6D26_00201 [Aureobasidium pullulans]
MAVASAYMASSGALNSAFSPFTDSPSSPVLYQSDFPDRSLTTSDTLAPPPSPYPQQIEPSPTDSNGTESTDIEEDVQDEVENTTVGTAAQCSRSQSRESLVRLDTTIALLSRSNSDEAPSSVIHAPPGFVELDKSHRLSSQSSTSTSNRHFDVTSTSPSTPDAAVGPNDKRMSSVTLPLDTNIPPEQGTDRPTPRAQTRQESDDEWKRRSRRTSSLEEGDIPETTLGSHSFGETNDSRPRSYSEDEVSELRLALKECWTLCNTLSNLSSNYRQRMFTGSGPDSLQEHAWRSCWYLCKQLYESYDNRSQTVSSILETCREFCHALFDVRLRGDESIDSVLRVSFEMNNHLYNTHDRNLPESFRERTLDFHVTLCHRMMKQQTSLSRETDALLRACWSLAETLFNLRQGSRDARRFDEMLASAIQACWDLSDIFREGWSHLRPDRSTPRPTQVGFPPSVSHYSTGQSDRAPSSLSSEYHDAPSLPPETPTTIFDDATTASSPESVDVPNILVLGPAPPISSSGSARGAKHHDRWSSNASTLSDYSESANSQRTSSTARANSDGKHLLRLRCLILRAAINTGFSRTSGQSLSSYVKSLPPNTFGNSTWQSQLLEHYKHLVTADRSLRSAATMPSRSLTALEVAKAVVWLSRSEDWRWLKDLYCSVMGFDVEEAEVRGGFFQI